MFSIDFFEFFAVSKPLLRFDGYVSLGVFHPG